jgi:hypothetical protein
MEGVSMSQHENRPWFGPKRIGYGLRPQTWQGWTLVLAFCALMIVIAVVAG